MWLASHGRSRSTPGECCWRHKIAEASRLASDTHLADELWDRTLAGGRVTGNACSAYTTRRSAPPICNVRFGSGATAWACASCSTALSRRLARTVRRKGDRLRSIFLGDPQSPTAGSSNWCRCRVPMKRCPHTGHPGTDSFCSPCSATSTRRCPAWPIGFRRRRTARHHAGPGRQDRLDGGHHCPGRRAGRVDRARDMSAPTALVTGGASGIGFEVAGRLRDAEFDVVVWDLSDADIACDVSDPDAVWRRWSGRCASTVCPPGS